MASRNERKRRAKARREELLKAANAIWREQAKPKPILTEIAYPCKFGGVAGSQRLTERDGKVQSSRGKRKFVSSEPNPFEPLKRDDNASGYGQLRKKYI